MKTAVAAKFDAAISSAQALEGMPSQQTEPGICDLIAALKQDLRDKIEALEEVETIIPCGQ